jgi:cytochrome o ubiquinol oxidase subunit 2
VDKKLKGAFLLLVLFGIASIGLLYLYSGSVAVLSPKGMIGEKQASVLIICTLIMLIAVIPVFLLTFFIVWKYHKDHPKAKYHPDWDYNHILESLWWGVPLVIIAVLSVITWKSCHELDPFKPISSEVKPLRIQVVALQWKWLFIYPEQNIATVNFVQFPEKTPIAFEISADAPMNSFWIPELGGQIYAMAGMRSKLHLMANGSGSYRGCSANISGKGFSGMTFAAKSSSQAEFDQWVESSRQSMALNWEEYNKLARPSENNAPAAYTLADPGLFDQIMMKYMTPRLAYVNP